MENHFAVRLRGVDCWIW